MKNCKQQLTVLAAFAFLLLSCNKEGDGAAGVVFTVSSEDAVTDVVKSNVSDFTAKPSASDFVLTLKNASAETVWTGKLSEWSVETPLTAGNYTVIATYGTEGAEGFDAPYYTGGTNFSINGGTTTKVNIPTKLANCIVKFSFTDAFKKYFTEYDFSVKTGAENVIAFPQTETRAAFVDAFKITVSGNLVNQGNAETTFGPKTYESLSEATCYTLKFDVTNVGGVKLSVSFNDTIDVIDLGALEINE